MKLGLSLAEIAAMAIDEGDAYLIAYNEILNPDKPKRYKVRKKSN